jgi:hypothetical protein
MVINRKPIELRTLSAAQQASNADILVPRSQRWQNNDCQAFLSSEVCAYCDLRKKREIRPLTRSEFQFIMPVYALTDSSYAEHLVFIYPTEPSPAAARHGGTNRLQVIGRFGSDVFVESALRVNQPLTCTNPILET